MTSRTHDIIAFAVLLTLAVAFPPTNLTVATLCVALIANVIGSLLPDIDQASNRLWDLLPAGDYIGNVFRRFLLRHRTLSHSLLGILLFYALLSSILPRVLNSQYVNSEIILDCIMVGYISHIIADAFTKEGIPLFFPLHLAVGIPPISALRIKTGSLIEKAIIFPLTVVYILWFIATHQRQLVTILQSVHAN